MSRHPSKTTDATEVWIPERGTSFGYNTLVLTLQDLIICLIILMPHIVFDVTHSVRTVVPGGSTGGKLFTWQDWHEPARRSESKTSS